MNAIAPNKKITSALELNVGDVVTCQFGNSSDTSGYQEAAIVTIMVIQNQLCGKAYLVKENDRESLGLATLGQPHDDVESTLYCTNARRYGDLAQAFTGIKTLEEAALSLGFRL